MTAALAARDELARTLIRRAGELAAGYAARLADLPVRSKGVQDVITEADVAVELLIKQAVADAFPGDALIVIRNSAWVTEAVSKV